MNQLNDKAAVPDNTWLQSKKTANISEKNSAAIAEPLSNGEFTLPLPKVVIFLCTYQGQKYLADQLESFASQTYPNWEIWASDDGSQDDTRSIMETYREKWGEQRLSIHSGPSKGFSAHFISLTCHADIKADYYAYSDQDDIWDPDKLLRAVSVLKNVPVTVPALYCGRTTLVDAKNKIIGQSPLFKKPKVFANALVQSVGGGNTMVFNNAARELLKAAGDADVFTHDWWAYIVITGCGGIVFYDDHSFLRYRQHEDNLIGMNAGWGARLNRIKKLFRGKFRDWNDRHIVALKKIRLNLTPENQLIFDRFSAMRDCWLPARLFGLVRCGIYRQTLLGNLGLIVAVLFKKI